MLLFFAKAIVLIALVLAVSPLIFFGLMGWFGPYFGLTPTPDSLLVRFQQKFGRHR